MATSALGKVIRITKTGQPAPGNPTFSQAGARPELYAIGHRNSQGTDGALYTVTDQGRLYRIDRP